MISIDLKNNNGFKWHKNGNIYAKGYFFDKNNDLYIDNTITGYFSDVTGKEQFIELLKAANGIFSVIIQNEDAFLMATDRIRTFPLFYSARNEGIHISDDASYLKHYLHLEGMEGSNVDEFLTTGYVTGNGTLLNGLYQVQAGEILYYKDNKLTSGFYYNYCTRRSNDISFDSLKNHLSEIFKSTFARFLSSLQGRHVVIPLSGGFDSRLIAVMLKQSGYDNVICYTYGRKKNNPEIPVSKKVAERLGYKWYYIEYNEERIKGYLADSRFQEYYNFCSNYSSMFFMQEYFAVKYLKQQKLIHDNSVFVPGLTGDVLGGSHLSGKVGEKTKRKTLVQEIYDMHYTMKKHSTTEKTGFLERIQRSLPEEDFFSCSMFENWDHKERQAKFIVNSVRTFEFFGYGFRLPLWDSELVEFFKKTPYKYKLYKLLYDDVLKNTFFSKYDLNFHRELQPSSGQLKLQKLKGLLKSVLPKSLIPERIKRDYLYYMNITDIMIRDMKKRNKHIDLTGKDRNSIIVQWYIDRISG